jgi:hypothetical protein
MLRHRMRFAAPLLVALVLAACEDSEPPKNPFDPSPDAPKPFPKLSAAAEPQGPPDLSIDTVSVKIGPERAFLDKPTGSQDLNEALAKHARFFEGSEVTLRVDRQAKLPWVSEYIATLASRGATRVRVKTETRPDFPGELLLTPAARAQEKPACSVVAMIMADRGTAVWKLSGGTAGRRGKGMAGPDLTMTGDSIERVAKACKESDAFFFSAANGVEWGLAYDLAASTRALPKAKFDTLVLIPEAPVPGHSVEL